jgi:hypothetical protein
VRKADNENSALLGKNTTGVEEELEGEGKGGRR